LLKATFTHPPAAAKCATVLTSPHEGASGEKLSNYQVGAFEALEWTWHMLRGYRGQPRGVDEARRIIQEVLSKMGEGTSVDFEEKISEVKTAVKYPLSQFALCYVPESSNLLNED